MTMNHNETCGKCHTSGPCEHTIPKITAKDVEELKANMLKKALMSPAERERERMEAKKPVARVSKCRVCNGKVTEEYTVHYAPMTMHTPIGGPLRPGWWQSDGLSCQKCGLKYAKVT